MSKQVAQSYRTNFAFAFADVLDRILVMDNPDIISSNKHKRTAIGIVILLLFAFYSARSAVFSDLMPADYLLGFVMQILMVMFCVADSHVVQKRFIHSCRWIMFFSWPVSVPIYFLWTRGLKGFLYIAAFSIIVVSVSLLAFYLTYHLANPV